MTVKTKTVTEYTCDSCGNAIKHSEPIFEVHSVYVGWDDTTRPLRDPSTNEPYKPKHLHKACWPFSIPF